VFLSAGEPSGDVIASEIVSHVRALAKGREVEFEGIGAAKLRQSGAKIVFDSSSWGAIGWIEVLRQVFSGLRGYFQACKVLNLGCPGLLILIDCGVVNLRIAKVGRKAGWRVIYVNPPGSWRRDRQGKDLPGLTDKIVTPFPWSAEILRKMGADAHWFGHPIKQLIRESSGDITRGDTIAILPGSRKAEVEQLLPVIASAIGDDERTLEFAVAPSFSPEQMQSRWRILCPNRKNDRFIANDTYGVLKRARAGIICSGTATLEAALCGCPFVVVYRVSKLIEIESYIIRVVPDFISQPNILMQRPIVRELLQSLATPERIRESLNQVLEEGEYRSVQIAAFEELNDFLGSSTALTETAKLIIQELDSLFQKEAPV
jgi:lipid-A-disaccharide synthase